MGLWLTVEGRASDAFSVSATGRNADVVGALERNLMLETYRDLAREGPPLRLEIANEIPLGMGCGSSAAALLAGVFLANHFGRLGMSPEEAAAEACRREGHPDNVAACFFGGLTASSMQQGRLTAASFGCALGWRLLLALPGEGLATSKARALLPESYTRADAVANVQATALLMAAFAQDRPDLLAAGTRDRMHQPYRSEVCPLLPRLLPLAGVGGIYSVTLSGAGPSVLLLADPKVSAAALVQAIRGAAGEEKLEILETSIAGGATVTVSETR